MERNIEHRTLNIERRSVEKRTEKWWACGSDLPLAKAHDGTVEVNDVLGDVIDMLVAGVNAVRNEIVGAFYATDRLVVRDVMRVRATAE